MDKLIRTHWIGKNIQYRIAVLVFFWLLAHFPAFAQPFTIKSGLFDQTKTDDVGLSAAKGTETHTVFSPTSSTDHYSNNVVLVAFKDWLYCQWQSSATDEDSDDTWTAYSRSKDGKTWTAPMKLAVPFGKGRCSAGGWWIHGDTLIAYINVWPQPPATDPSGNAYYMTSTDGLTWSKITPLPMKDGTPMKGVIEQGFHALPSGRLIAACEFQPGLTTSPIYSDDPSGIRGWVRASYTNLAHTGLTAREIEPSWFLRSDGVPVMVFRDQNSTNRVWASSSTDKGKTWPTAVETDMPDGRAKQCAGNLPDATAFMVNNPVNVTRRSPLGITLSKDGKTFTQAYAIRKGGSDLQAQRYTGKAKTLGYSYPKSTIWNGYLYVSYSTNKEDVQYTRIPLGSLQLNSPITDIEIDVMTENKDIKILVEDQTKTVFVSLPDNQKEGILCIFDLNGQSVFSSEIQGGQIRCDLESKPTGMYLVQVTTGSLKKTQLFHNR